MATQVRRAAAISVAGAGAAASLRALLKPLPTAEGRLVDWAAVERTAVARSGRAALVAPQEELATGYDAVAQRLAPLMAEVCGDAAVEHPPIAVLDRPAFITTNLAIARRLLAPVEEARAGLPSSRLTVAGRRVTDRYIGELFGFISQRVLGQYDPVLSLEHPQSADPPSLFIVEQNVVAFEERARIPSRPLREWLVLHELTHAWQFGAHPWVRQHLVSLIEAMLQSALRLAGAAPASSGERLRARLGGNLRVQLRGLGRVQVIMSVLEGHANFVMHRTGRRHIERFDELEQAFHRRQTERTALERLVLTVTGISMKLRQYEVGERFCLGVADTAGIDVLNRVWEGPDMVPTSAELRTPAIWVRRVSR